MNKDDVLDKITDRDPDSHKYDFGHLAVIGGSKKYTGAIALNSLAAYRTGVDLVTVVAPRRAADIAATFSPSLITFPVEGECFNTSHLTETFDVLDSADALVVGGGIGRDRSTIDFLSRLLSKINIPTVVDADALYAVSENLDIIGESFVLTPHQREFARLCGKDPSKVNRNREDNAKEFASEHQCTLVLKGAEDIITDGEKRVVNKTGNVWMTRGGTGDVLAGIIGSLLAQGIEPFAAASTGTWINGRAADLIVQKNHGIGLLAEEIIANIPEVIKS